MPSRLLLPVQAHRGVFLLQLLDERAHAPCGVVRRDDGLERDRLDPGLPVGREEHVERFTRVAGKDQHLGQRVSGRQLLDGRAGGKPGQRADGLSGVAGRDRPGGKVQRAAQREDLRLFGFVVRVKEYGWHCGSPQRSMSTA